ncbi:biotin/lipoyl-binding protein [Mesobaculum littorinae]|nr:biotin/lipoyl-binding protein [Mesobaculum littorinae]
MPRGFRHCPRARRGAGGALWFAAALSGLVLLAGGTHVALRDVAVPARQSYPGRLVAAAAPLTLDLPAGVPLGAITVARGDRVAAGQTLAVLDRPELARQLAVLRRERLFDMALRACLLAGGGVGRGAGRGAEGQSLEDLPGLGPEAPPDPETLAGLDRVREDCALESETALHEADRVAAAEAALRDELALLETGRRLLMQDPPEGLAERRALAARAVALAGERTRLEKRRADLELAARAADHARRRARLDRIAALSDRIAAATEAETRLVRHHDAPRLSLPEGGEVVRVRQVPAGTTLDDPGPILELRPGGPAAYLVRAEVPIELAHRLRPGAMIRITLDGAGARYGTGHGGPGIEEEFTAPLRLSGRLTGTLRPADAAHAVLTITPDPDSSARLRDQPLAAGLDTLSSAVSVSVALEDTTLHKAAGRSLMALSGRVRNGWSGLLASLPASLSPTSS